MRSIIGSLALALTLVSLISADTPPCSNAVLQLTCQRTVVRSVNGIDMLATQDHHWVVITNNNIVEIYDFNPCTGKCSAVPTWQANLPTFCAQPFFASNGTDSYVALFGGDWFNYPNKAFIQIYRFDPMTGTCNPIPVYDVQSQSYYFYKGAKIQHGNNLFFAFSGGTFDSNIIDIDPNIKTYSFDFATGTPTQTDKKVATPGTWWTSGVAWYDTCNSNPYLAFGEAGNGNVFVYAFDMATGLMGVVATGSINYAGADAEGLSFTRYGCYSYLGSASTDLTQENKVIQIFRFDQSTGAIDPVPTAERFISGGGAGIAQMYGVGWAANPYYFAAVGTQGFIGLYAFDPILGTLSQDPIYQVPPVTKAAQGLLWDNGISTYLLVGSQVAEGIGSISAYALLNKPFCGSCCRSHENSASQPKLHRPAC